MSLIENLTPLKRKFFENIGIFNDSDIPETFFETIKSLRDNLIESEQFCISDYNISFSSIHPFCIKDLIGTDHDRYAGKSWIEAFLDLDRGDKNLQLYFDNPSYYQLLQTGECHDLGLAKKDGKYYILGQAGGGNNRLIIMKLKYLALANKNSNDINKIDSEHTFYANVRHVPKKETANNIFYLTFPDGSYKTSGYYVVNRSSDENIELYDIVEGYPLNTKVIASNLTGEEIKEFGQNISKSR